MNSIASVQPCSIISSKKRMLQDSASLN